MQAGKRERREDERRGGEGGNEFGKCR